MSERAVGIVTIVVACAWLVPAGIIAFRELLRMVRTRR